MIQFCNNTVCNVIAWFPLPSKRHHRSSDDLLQGKKENWSVLCSILCNHRSSDDCLEGKRVCSVLCCVQQLCTYCTHMNRLNRCFLVRFSFLGLP